MSERNDRTERPDDQQNAAAKPRDEEVSADELEKLEEVSGGGNFNCGCSSQV